MGRLRTNDHGLIVVVDPSADKPLMELKTTQCVHCGGHFELKPPKLITHTLTPFEAAVREEQGKIVRGFCQRCNGYVCGPGCAACVPTELYIENLEKGRPADYVPVVVPTSFHG